jgi:hypothetical protein
MCLLQQSNPVDEREGCNGYAIGKKVHAKDASAETERLAYECDGLGRKNDLSTARGLTMSK